MEEIVQTDKPVDKPQDPDREASRLKRAIKAQQAEAQAARDELAALRAQIETDKLSAAEKDRKELDAIKAQAAESTRLLAEQSTANKRLQLVNRMITKHKLADEEYADVILKQYVADEHEDFDAFMTDVVTKPKYKVFFAQEPERVAPVAPATPGNGTNRDVAAPKTSAEDKNKDFAMSQYPNDPARRETLVRNLRALAGE